MYKEHPVYVGYTCNIEGQIKGPSGRLLTQRLSNAKAKTYSVLVKHNNRTLTVSAKTLVYETWVGDIPKGSIVLSSDGDETNTKLSNLKLSGQELGWKPHPVHYKYKGNSKGQVLGKSGRGVNPTLCKASGYLRMCMKSDENKSIPYLAHRFIVECELGELIPESLTVNHIDGDKTNNSITNLEVVTQAHNNEHAKQTGLCNNFLENSAHAKLNNEQVRLIKERIATGETVASIHKDYEDVVGLWALYRIKQGRSWNRL